MEADDDIEQIAALSTPLSFNNKTHELFFRSLKRVWEKQEFSPIPSDLIGKIVYARERLDKIARRDPSVQFTDITITHKDTDSLTRLVLTMRDYKTLMVNIFKNTSWKKEVTSIEQIPTEIRSAFLKRRVDLRTFFERVKNSDTAGPYTALCAPRFLYFVNGNGSCSLEDNDDCDYASSSSRSESESEMEIEPEDAPTSQKPEVIKVEVQSEVQVFLNTFEEVIRTSMRDGPSFTQEDRPLSKIHPYQLSCAVFTMCQRIESEGWAARRIYCYIKDFLSDQVLLEDFKEEKVRNLATEILNHVSGVQESLDFQNLLDAFEGVHAFVSKHRRKFRSDKLQMRRGRLEPFDKMTTKDLSNFARDHYYPFHSPSRGRIPSIFHCPCANSACKPEILSFSRSRVSPLQIHSSLCICERRFRKTEHRPWSMLFTRNKVILIIDPIFFREITSDYVPYLINREKVIERTVAVPTYYVYIHSYFYGSNMGLCNSMDFLLRSFSRMRYSNSAYIPKDMNDPTIESYRLLHLIMDKFETTEQLNDYIRYPLGKHTVTYGNKRKLSALEEDLPTIYAALKSFVLIYAPHTITKFALTMLYDKFIESPQLREGYKLAWKLVRKLLKLMGLDKTEILIPPDLFKYKGDDYDQDPSTVFDFPSHLLFYYLCASGDLSPRDSRTLFLSIGTYTRISGQLKLANFCSSISIKKPLRSADRVKYAGGFIAYELLNIKEGITPVSIPFSHGITHLFRTLEDGDYEIDETLVPLSSDHILADKASPPPVPLDFRHNCMPRTGCCLPIWKSLVYDQSYRTNDILSSTENIGRPMVYTGDLEMRPFWGCHEDMLECIVIHPIRKIQSLSVSDTIDPQISQGIPLDLRDTSSPTPHTPGGSPVVQRIEHYSQKFLKMYEDRNGWSFRPGLIHVMSRALHSQ